MKGSTQEAFVDYSNRKVMKESNKGDNNHEQKKMLRLFVEFF